MRNTKIALAVLALVASTAAMAEGVTISGVLDAGNRIWRSRRSRKPS